MRYRTPRVVSVCEIRVIRIIIFFLGLVVPRRRNDAESKIAHETTDALIIYLYYQIIYLDAGGCETI
jgi:hypothetical protein